MKNQFIIPLIIIAAAILGGFWVDNLDEQRLYCLVGLNPKQN